MRILTFHDSLLRKRELPKYLTDLHFYHSKTFILNLKLVSFGVIFYDKSFGKDIQAK